MRIHLSPPFRIIIRTRRLIVILRATIPTTTGTPSRCSQSLSDLIRLKQTNKSSLSRPLLSPFLTNPKHSLLPIIFDPATGDKQSGRATNGI